MGWPGFRLGRFLALGCCVCLRSSNSRSILLVTILWLWDTKWWSPKILELDERMTHFLSHWGHFPLLQLWHMQRPLWCHLHKQLLNDRDDFSSSFQFPLNNNTSMVPQRKHQAAEAYEWIEEATDDDYSTTYPTSMTSRFLTWKKWPSRIKTTGSFTCGLSTLMKFSSHCVKMCK